MPKIMLSPNDPSFFEPVLSPNAPACQSAGLTPVSISNMTAPPVMTPFFQASQRSLAYQFTIIAPLLYPPFSNFRKNFNFQPCFGQNFSSQDPNFRSLDPSFFKENPLPRPYFWKPVWHTPTKKKLSAPPRALHMPFFYIHEFCEYKSPQNKAE